MTSRDPWLSRKCLHEEPAIGNRWSVISAICHFPFLIAHRSLPVQVISCLQLSAFVWRLRSQFPAQIQSDCIPTEAPKTRRRISNYVSQWSLHLSGWRSAALAVHNFNLTKHIRSMAVLIGAIKLDLRPPGYGISLSPPNLPTHTPHQKSKSKNSSPLHAHSACLITFWGSSAIFDYRRRMGTGIGYGFGMGIEHGHPRTCLALANSVSGHVQMGMSTLSPFKLLTYKFLANTIARNYK